MVVPTYNRPRLLARCLDHLEQQSLPAADFEVLVVDDASSEPIAEQLSAEYAGSPLPIRWLRVEPNSPARARNRGIEEARGEFILFIGDDILGFPAMLQAHLDAHAECGENDAVLCRVATDPALLTTPFQRWFDPFGYDRLNGDQFVGHKFFWTNNISLRTAFLRQHGTFDEDFTDAHHEDVELGWRLERAGLRIYFKDSVVAHHHHAYTVEGACRLMYGRGQAYHILRLKVPEGVFRQHLGIFSWHNSPVHVARSLIRIALVNRFTATAWLRWLSVGRDSRLRRFFYWKLLAYHTNLGFRETASA